MVNWTLQKEKKELRERILKLSKRYPKEVWEPLWKRISRIRRKTELERFKKRVELWE